MRKLPGFSKLYLPSSSKRLRIPSDFPFVVGARLDTVSLKNCKGDLWPVKVAKYGDVFFLDGGWNAFVKDNSVKNGDILVFDFDGKEVFNVRLFGKGEGWENLGIQKGVDDEEEAASDELEEDGEDEEEEDNYSHGGDEDYEEFLKKRRKKEQSSRKSETSHHEGKSFFILKVECTKDANDGAKSINIGGSARVPDIIKDTFKSGLVPLPENPFFVARIYVKKPNDLSIPRRVIEHHKIKLQPTIELLLDELGRTWDGKVKEWKDGRIRILRAWGQFRKGNSVRPEDRCICEFVSAEGATLLKMRILRKRPW